MQHAHYMQEISTRDIAIPTLLMLPRVCYDVVM